MLVRFWVNHHLLDIFQRPLWRVVKGRSREYVKRVCSGARTCDGTGVLTYTVYVWEALPPQHRQRA